jgi:alpha-galactosidase
VFQAVAFDPLTSAVLGIQKIKEMVKTMFRQNEGYLEKYTNLS